MTQGDGEERRLAEQTIEDWERYERKWEGLMLILVIGVAVAVVVLGWAILAPVGGQ